MKVIFVGMHNKPGMKPLDSKTKTGKIVDEIIPFIKCSCIKSNLCDVDYMPTSNEDIHMFNIDATFIDLNKSMTLPNFTNINDVFNHLQIENRDKEVVIEVLNLNSHAKMKNIRVGYNNDDFVQKRLSLIVEYKFINNNNK